jgi:hypothetical protein
MRDLTTIIEILGTVRQARRQFLRHWRLERVPVHIAATPSALDRLADDVARAGNAYDDSPVSELTSTLKRTTLKSRTMRLYLHGRLADEWE